MSAANKLAWRCASWKTNEYGVYRINWDGEVECKTGDVEATGTCRVYTTLQACESAVDQPMPWLTCGDKLQKLTKKTTGYDTPTHWCSRVVKAWSSNDPRVFSCRWWNRNFIATRKNEYDVGECFAVESDSCLTYMDSTSCEDELLKEQSKPFKPFICDTHSNARTNDTTSWCHDYKTGKTMPPLTTLPSTLVPEAVHDVTSPLATTLPTTVDVKAKLPSETKPAETKGGVDVGILLTMCILMAVVGFGFVFVWRRKFSSESGRQPRVQRAATAHINLGTINAYRLDNSDLVLTKLLVVNDNSEIHLGMYKEQMVAVKRITSGDVTLFEQFVQKTTLQASLKSPFVVDCLGACWEDPLDMKCVMEYMDCRDLKLYLSTHDSNTFPWAQKLQCIQDLVHSIAFLHDMPRVHGALRSRSVLIDTTKGTKVSDFGLLDGPVSVSSFQWVAPEVLESSRYTTASDMYSFGVILSEFDTHQVPYTGVKNEMTGKLLPDTAIMSLVQQGRIKPSFDGSMPGWLVEIAVACMSHDPSKRPTIAAVAKAIRLGLTRKSSKVGILI